MSIKSSFSDFTNLYELSKTLRFELKATNELTKNMISGTYFDEDKKRQEKRHKLLNLVDNLLRIYIDEIFKIENLSNISFTDYYEEYKKLKLKKKNKEKFEKEDYQKENELGKKIINLYSKKVFIEKLKKEISFEDLLKEEVLEYIKLYYIEGNEEDGFSENDKEILLIISLFKNKFSSLQDYIKSRKETIFSESLKQGSLAFRIVRENLKRFIENIEEFEKILFMFENGDLNFIKDEFKLKREDKLLDGINTFELNYYKNCFLQNGINKYNEKIGTIRSILNTIIQEIKNENKKRKKEGLIEKQLYLPKRSSLKILDKQILGETHKVNKEYEIKDLEEFFEKLKELLNLNNSDNQIKSIKNNLLYFFDTIKAEQEEFDLSKIYLNTRAIETLSGKFFNDFGFLIKILPGKIDGKKKRLNDFYTFEQLKKSFIEYSKDKENIEIDTSIIFKEKYFKDQDIIEKESKDFFQSFLKALKYEFLNIFQIYENENIIFSKLINDFEQDENLGDLQKEDNINIIQNYSKACLDIYRMISYFFPIKKTKEGMEFLKSRDDEDENLYEDLHIYFDENIIVNYFNLFRNFVSKKPYSDSKVNVSFDVSQLLDGWQERSDNGSMQYRGVVLREQGKYFLGILKNGATSFNKERHESEFNESLKEGEYYEFMEYKQAKWGNNIVNNYGNTYGNKYTDDILNIGELKVIENFKEILKKYVLNFPKLEELINNKYEKVDDLKNDFENLILYKINFSKIKKSYVDSLSGFYLFQIYSKDFSLYKEYTSSLDQQTNYFLGLFDEENLLNLSQNNGKSVFKLEGGAQVFFREKTEKLPNREKNKQEMEFLNTRREDKNGNKLENKIDKVKENRRYSENKLMFHFPIKINFGKNDFDFTRDGVEKFNEEINKSLIKTGKIKKIIGLDRGEKHLVYLSLIDENGKIELSKTLNLVGKDSSGNLVDYKKKLDDVEKQRLGQRKSWKQISQIKNLKEGYISQIVKEIVDLSIKENALIVMEDLNLTFKNNRKGVEKEVYQKFEKALLKKLNYIVDKNGNFSNYRNGLQLTPKIDDLKVDKIDKSKQLGIVLYVNPGYTSQTCPNCNFVRDIYLKYEGLTKSIERLKDFEIIFKNNEFVFKKRENQIITKSKKGITDIKTEKEIKFFSGIERLKKDRANTERNWETKIYNPTKELENLFRNFNIEISGNITEQVTQRNSKELYESLFGIINTILSIRNSETERETLEQIKIHGNSYMPKDFINCPVCKFHSEKKENISKSGEIRNIEKLENADANGAYNIARKGVIVLNKIKENKDDLFVSSEDWNDYIELIQYNLKDFNNDLNNDLFR